MRHDLLLAPPLAVAPCTPCVREAPGTAGLVASAGFAQRLSPCRARARAAAVALAAVAAAAHQHLGAAARAGECPCAARRLASPCIAHARPAAKRARIALRPAHERSPAPGAILRTHSRSTRVGRGGSNNLPVVAVAAPVLQAPFYRVLTGVGVAATPGGWGWHPQYKPSSIKSASGSDLCTPMRWLAGADLTLRGHGGCASSKPPSPGPSLGQFK